MWYEEESVGTNTNTLSPSQNNLFIYRMAFSAGSVRGYVWLAWCRSFYLTPMGDLRVRMWDDDDDDNEVGRG